MVAGRDADALPVPGDTDAAALVAELRRSGLRVDQTTASAVGETLRLLGTGRTEDLFWGLHAVVVRGRQDSAVFRETFRHLMTPRIAPERAPGVAPRMPPHAARAMRTGPVQNDGRTQTW